MLKRLFCLCLMSTSLWAVAQTERAVWTRKQANDWYQRLPWMVGANFMPSNAINQLEMWQEDTFSPELIDKELGYAEGIGMNVMRVYLHHLAWQQDPEGFKKRMDTYLGIADKHGIRTVFTIFDDCWNNTYRPGKQPEPKTGIHNSGWIQDPGELAYMDLNFIPNLEKYVKDVLKHFAKDDRILLWDLYNEPGNSKHGNHSMPLLQAVFKWGRQVNPSQPLSAGVWRLDLKELNQFQLENSDVITYHNYGDEKDHQHWLDSFLLKTGKPLICTEYMARTRNSNFANILPILKKYKIAAINWGLVSGKINTIYAWNAPMPNGGEPELWFHDVFRPDGTPYKKEETELIRRLTSGTSFVNPLLPSGADPWCVYHNGFYYYMHTTGGNISLRKTKDISQLASAERKVVYTPPAGKPYSKELWAPEIHFLRGKWYIYFAADDGNNVNHRMFVLENGNSDPMKGEFVFKSKLETPGDKWSIDGTVYEHNKQLYFLWSGWEGDVNGQQNIYIAKMSNPWTITGKRVLVSKPELPWEMNGDLNNPNDVSHVNVNEGPQILRNGNKLFLIYSASGCWTDHYALGMLTASANADLMNPGSWKKSPQPVFKQSPENGVYATGHNSFFKSPSGKEDWILYHANSQPGQGCGRFRSPRAQKFTWNQDGSPNFGIPVKETEVMEMPR